MNKVITISLNSNAYQLEEAGYDALQQYLHKAGAKLHDNPDKDEIMADFEQAIADKCSKYLKNQKNVITSKEIDEVLAEMGPVEDTADTEEKQHTKAEPDGDAPKRLFKIREGAVLAGVCNGIAAYAHTDANIVRIAFILLTIVTGGVWIAAYIIMAILMPEARTSEDLANAQGKVFNTKTFLASAHAEYEYWKKFGEEQAKDWKENKAEYKKEWKSWKRDLKKDWNHTKHPKVVAAHNHAERSEAYSGVANRISRGIAGFVGAMGIISIVALSLTWIVGFYGVFADGTILGYYGGTQKWSLVALLAFALLVILMPVQGIVGNALRYAEGRSVQPRFWGMIMQYLLWFGAIAGITLLVMNESQIRDGVVNMYNDAVKAHWFGL